MMWRSPIIRSRGRGKIGEGKRSDDQRKVKKMWTESLTRVKNGFLYRSGNCGGSVRIGKEEGLDIVDVFRLKGRIIRAILSTGSVPGVRACRLPAKGGDFTDNRPFYSVRIDCAFYFRLSVAGNASYGGGLV